MKLYRFKESFGRMGDLEGVFVAREEDVEALMGEEIYFGEVLGKHSEISLVIEPHHIKVVSDEAPFIEKLTQIFGGSTISGVNPLDYRE